MERKKQLYSCLFMCLKWIYEYLMSNTKFGVKGFVHTLNPLISFLMRRR